MLLVLNSDSFSRAYVSIESLADVFELYKNILALRDDLMELKPTLLAGVPRVFERIHEGILSY